MIDFTPLDPTFLTIGVLQFRYYGLMYVIAFILAYFYLNYLRKNNKIDLSINNMWDLLFYGTLGVLLGGRIGYILFYNLSYFFDNPVKIIAVWEGGMSFHGGLIGTVLAGALFCWIKKLNFLKLGDAVIVPLCLGIAMAKLGNFINGELYGRPLADTFYVPWGMYFEMANNDVLRHPSQLYEMSKNIVIFVVLMIIIKTYKSRADGILLFVFLTMYGLFRFMIEFVRQPDPQIGLFWNTISMGQILSAPMFVIGLMGLFYIHRIKFKN